MQETYSRKRASGVLLPLFSLPGPGGIGCFSDCVCQFARQLSRAGQKYWQILPLGVTGFGDSPYQSFSSFAGNPYFIDLHRLFRDELLSATELESYDQLFHNLTRIDYALLYSERLAILRRASCRFFAQGGDATPAFRDFLAEHQAWLPDFGLFMTIKAKHGGLPWQEWSAELRDREQAALHEFLRVNQQEYQHQIWMQFEFFRQWAELKSYINSLGISVIGDLPIYAAGDSADVWSNRFLFEVDAKGDSLRVSGCPPDAFAPEGQVWGNPLYDWSANAATGYAWWKARLKHNFSLYDVIRFDHFRGLESYFVIPAGAGNALAGSWEKGPGLEFFKAVDPDREFLIIAEDLGYLTQEVKDLLQATGFPGMKIIEFAFDSREAGDYYPYTYVPNSVVYTGTHDNEPLLSWYRKLESRDKQQLWDYLGPVDHEERAVCEALMNLSFASVCDYCITPLWDLLFLGEEARINTPSTLGGNWAWRMSEADLAESSWVDFLAGRTQIYGR